MYRYRTTSYIGTEPSTGVTWARSAVILDEAGEIEHPNLHVSVAVIDGRTPDDALHIARRCLAELVAAAPTVFS